MGFLIVSETLLLASLGAIVLLLNRWKPGRRLKIISISILAVILVWRVSTSYLAIFPPNGYFNNGFEHLTMQPVPESATIQSKYATFPNNHGDFSMACLMELSERDYSELFNSMRTSNETHEIDDIIWNESLDRVCINRNDIEIDVWFKRTIPGEENNHFYIGFQEMNNTILYSICY